MRNEVTLQATRIIKDAESKGQKVEAVVEITEYDYLLLKPFFQGLAPTMRIPVTEWANKYRYLAAGASARPGLYDSANTPYLIEIMDCLGATSDVSEVVFMKSAQVGAALPLDTPIPTPYGWTTMGDLRKGDTILGADGKPTKVVFATRTMNGKQCYEIEFSDGTVQVCDNEHRWAVDEYKWGKCIGAKTIIAQEIFETFKDGKRNRYAVKVTKPLHLSEKKLPVPPYTFGCWLGDGNSYSNRITTHKDDIIEMSSYMKAEGVDFEITDKHCKGNCAEIVLDAGKRPSNNYTTIYGHIIKMGVAKNKHIPIEYLRASETQRWNLLRGLMDTDGHIDKKGHCAFYSNSMQLIDGVCELLVSLGLKYTTRTKIGSGKKNDCVFYCVEFTAYFDNPPVKLRRKKINLNFKRNGRPSETYRRRIVDVRKCKSVPVRCIQVDNKDHLYLCGKNMVPTHNTEAGNNWLGYIIHIAPGATLMVVPTDAMMRNNSNVRIDPMIAASPVLRSRIGKGKKDGNTTSRKKFAGGFHIYCGANSPVGLSSLPIQYLFFDETDRYPVNVGKEGSAISLGKARTNTYEDVRKIFYVSTPTVDGISAIQKEFENSDRRYYHVPCPHCATLQHLKFSQLKWVNNDPETAKYECEHCHEEIEEKDKRWMLDPKRARWIATNPDFKNKRRRGYHINAMYSLLGYKWSNAVRDWLEAQGDDLKLCTFYNTVLGEVWKEVVDVPDWQSLYSRRQSYTLNTPPKNSAIITAGVDVQKDRIEVEIVAWCANKESYSLDYRVLKGDIDTYDAWGQLDKIVNETWVREGDNAVMPMRLMCVDSSAFTDKVYEWARKYDQNRVIPIKGRDKLDMVIAQPKAVDIAKDGKPIGTMRVWGVGSSFVKSELYGWLRTTKVDGEPVPTGYCNFPMYGEHYFKQLTSEQKVIRVNTKGYREYQWTLPAHARNEALDCRVYARAAMAALGCDRWKAEDWEAMRIEYLPKTTHGAPAATTTKKNGSGFLDGKSIW